MKGELKTVSETSVIISKHITFKLGVPEEEGKRKDPRKLERLQLKKLRLVWKRKHVDQIQKQSPPKTG